MARLTEADCERIGAASVADLSYDEIRSLHGRVIAGIVEVAANQEPPNLGMLGLLKAVCSQQEANIREYGYGAELEAEVRDQRELSEVIDAHIRQAELKAGQQG